jgi:hypothetical protein
MGILRIKRKEKDRKTYSVAKSELEPVFEVSAPLYILM